MPRGASQRAKKMRRTKSGAFLPLPEGKKGKNLYSERNRAREWSREDTKELKALIRENTPTRVIGLKLGRTVGSVRYHVRKEGLSLKPTNRSPYGRAKRGSRTSSASASARH